MIILFNPAAGRRGRRLWPALAWLREHGFRPELVQTQGPGDAIRLARDAAEAGARLVVAAGGDGTIAEVAQGIAGSPASLGVLPLGTANVLAAELGLPRHPWRAAQVLAQGRQRPLYPGVAHFADGSSRLFVQMLGVGFDAAVVAGIDLALKRRIGRAAYVWQALRQLPGYGFPCCRVVMEGREHSASSVVVCKGRLYAGRHLLAPAARPGAPGFQVAVLQPAGPGSILLGGLALPLDLLPRLPGLSLHQASRVTLHGAGMPVQMDGDPAGGLPVTIEDASGPINILVP